MKLLRTLPFTEAQLDALRESQITIAQFDHAVTGHEITYDREKDPAKDIDPNLYSMDKIWADMGMRSRNSIVKLPLNDLSVTMISSRPRDGEAAKSFKATTGGTYKNPEDRPYQRLKVTHRGLLSFGDPTQAAHEQHTLYSVDRPGSLYHGLGIITGAVIAPHQELIPIEPESGLGHAVKEAGRRLGAIAKTAANKDYAEDMMTASEAADTQKYIHSTSYEAVNGWQIATAERARYLGQIISLAVNFGELEEREM